MPHGWEACKLSSKDYEPCLIKQVNKAIQTLKGGSKILAVNPLDPLRILSLNIDQGSGPVSIKLAFKDTDIAGLSTCVLKQVKNDWKRLEGSGPCKYLIITGQYKIDGKILSLPIKGEGKAKVHIENAQVKAVMNLKETRGKDGKKHFVSSEFEVDISPSKTSYEFENLFNGNKALSDNMNTFLNENGDQIFKELKPAISVAVSSAFVQITNQVFSKISVDEINIK